MKLILKRILPAAVVALLSLAALVLYVLVRLTLYQGEPRIEIYPDNPHGRTVLVVADAEFSPFSFRDGRGEPAGFDVELLYAAANIMRVNIVFDLMEWSAAKDAVASGRAHFITGNPYGGPGTDGLLQSVVLTNDQFVCIGRVNFSYVGYLNDKRLATIEKSGAITDFLEPYKLTGNTTYYPSYTDAVRSVISGENDYAIVRYSVGRRILADLGAQDVGLVGPVLANSLLCVGVNANHPDLAASLDAAIRQLQANGVKDALAEKWLGRYVERFSFGDVLVHHADTLFIIGLIVLLIVAVVAFFVHRGFLKAAHARQSAHLQQEKLQAELEALDSKIAGERAKAEAEAVLAGIEYASTMQKNLLPSPEALAAAFSDCSVIFCQRDIVGGDIYWLKRFDKGTVLCVCDCTGHGTPGALLTMIVVSALEGFVNEKNCSDTAEIVWLLERNLVNVFSHHAADLGAGSSELLDGCDLAVLFVANDKSVSISAGQTDVFICDGHEVRRLRGQKIFVGEGKLTGKDDVRVTVVPPNPAHKYYIASDGLFDQPGGPSGAPFAYKTFKEIILSCHHEPQCVIGDKIWDAFEEYRAGEPKVDDFVLVAFKP
ncbi:MAG: transporter substrate-binding domain-containing protein [Oscillospiraceae bacterium]|jgi:ABC-type amino acid transport substrate-binding protein/serine phosphatase RsbU (regulator of sigma subunit)|nr:transporter substrate-binding domain-containing protein [Oscillospiraceae bacterium]